MRGWQAVGREKGSALLRLGRAGATRRRSGSKTAMTVRDMQALYGNQRNTCIPAASRSQADTARPVRIPRDRTSAASRALRYMKARLHRPLVDQLSCSRAGNEVAGPSWRDLPPFPKSHSPRRCCMALQRTLGYPHCPPYPPPSSQTRANPTRACSAFSTTPSCVLVAVQAVETAAKTTHINCAVMVISSDEHWSVLRHSLERVAVLIKCGRGGVDTTEEG